MSGVYKRFDGKGRLIAHTIDGAEQPINHSPSVPAITAQPWPLALLPLKLLAQEGDRGAGDIIARVIGPIGGDAFKKWYKKLFGKSCGCGNRKEILNQRWPLTSDKP